MRLNQWTVNLSPGGLGGTENPNSLGRTFGVAFFALCAALILCAGCVSVSGKDPTLRTPGQYLADRRIEAQADKTIAAADERFANARVKVVSYDGVVLLVGQVPDDALRARAERVVDALPEVRRVHNELQVSGATSLVARANDDWLTTKVVSRFAASDEVNANRVKVVAEDGVVYLVGILPPAEADQAAQVARTVFGVNKVVKVFDYLEG